MCGITGKLGCGRVDEALISRMSGALEHRGPDASGSFVDDGVGIGVRRLAVIDVETGDQPVFNEDRSVLVVLNGEVYNYVELRAELERRGHRFRTNGDTEVIVHLYEEDGPACVRRLRGMFAFAVWDRARRRLTLARDRLGKKPLHYAESRGTLWFASELRALLEDPEVPRAVDYRAIDAYLQLQYVPGPHSAFLGLAKLPPAHVLTWQRGELEVSRYWRLSYSPKAQSLDGADACERVRDTLLEATRLRLRSDAPLGAMLSGGVDSSAVVAAMALQSPHRVRTFTIGFENASFDERSYARRVASEYDTEHHELVVRPDAAEITPEVAWHYGEPFADHSAVPSLYLAALTKRHVKVVLNGDGGDESFAGYGRHAAGALALRLSGIPQHLRQALAGGVRIGARAPIGGSWRPRLVRLAATLADPGAGLATWLGFFSREQLDRLYTPEFRAALDPFSASAMVEAGIASSDADNPLDAVLDVEVQTYLPGDLLVKIDIATMASSIEARSPLLDHELVELAAKLPARMKLRGRGHKHVFKQALRPLLPAEILDRPKMGFTIPLAQWFRGELRELPRQVLLDRVAVDRGMFRADGVSTMIDDHVSGRADNANRIWALLQLELWLRTFIDSRRTSPLTLAAR